jgi:multidrug resistance efflux pump
MFRESSADGALDLAIRRLERATSLLEQRVSTRRDATKDVGPFEQDRARLAAELDESRARERELKEAGTAASEALGRAIDEIKAALVERPPEAE